MNNTRQPDTELANAIRTLQNEVDAKIFVLENLRKQYSGNDVIEWGDYIHSVAWEETRQKVFRRDGFRCTVCGSSVNLNCHHITYENLGAEKLSDLVTLCQKCHEKVHEKVHNGEEVIPKKLDFDVPSGFTLKEWQLLLCVYALGETEYFNLIDEEFWIKPKYFQSFRAKRFVDRFVCGMGFADEEIESKLFEHYDQKTSVNILIDLYYSMLRSVFDDYFVFYSEYVLNNYDDDNRRLLLGYEAEIKKHLTEKVGEM